MQQIRVAAVDFQRPKREKTGKEGKTEFFNFPGKTAL
jgi:hypothetical protein